MAPRTMNAIRAKVAAVALSVLAVALTSPPAFPVPLAAQAASTLSQLRGMQEVRSWFNTSRGRPRLILLLSPT